MYDDMTVRLNESLWINNSSSGGSWGNSATGKQVWSIKIMQCLSVLFINVIDHTEVVLQISTARCQYSRERKIICEKEQIS